MTVHAYFVCCAAAAAAACAAPAPVLAPRTAAQSTPLSRAAARLPLSPCTLPGVNETVLCGELRVPENPDRPESRSIPIYVVVIPALSSTPQPDPWVEISGGPGNAATDYTRDYVGTGVSRAYRRDRDVLLMDPRGMGKSNALYCEGLALNRISSLFPRWHPDSVRSCREKLAAVADLSQYSTANAADDLEAVRVWLGYPKLNLWGYSYGTRSVLTYMQRHPAAVRSAILWGVVSPDYRRPLFYARDSQQAMDRLLSDCLADSLCARAFPQVREELATVLRQLDRTPVPVTLKRPITGEPLPTAITRAGFAQGLWVALSVPDEAHKLPMVIHHAALGDFKSFLEMDVATTPPRRRYYNAAHLSIICPEETQHIRPDEIEKLHRGSFMPPQRTYEYIAACRIWAVPTLTASTLEPIRSNVPTLIVSGYMDPFTPPELGDQVASHLTNSRHLVIRHLSHEPNGMSGADCLDSLSLNFVAKPEPAKLDARCTARMGPPAFVLSPRPPS